MINELPPPAPTTKKKSALGPKVIGLFTGGVIVIAGISLIGSNAGAEKNVPSAVETGASAGITGGGATVGEAPDWRNPAAIADKAVDKVEEIQNAPTTTEAPITSAPTTSAPPVVMTDLEKNTTWWTNGGEALVTKTSDLLGRFTEPGVAEEIMVSASAMAVSAPDTEMGRHVKAAGEAYAKAGAAYSDAYAGDLDHLNASLEVSTEFMTTGNAEMELATAAIAG